MSEPGFSGICKIGVDGIHRDKRDLRQFECLQHQRCEMCIEDRLHQIIEPQRGDTKNRYTSCNMPHAHAAPLGLAAGEGNSVLYTFRLSEAKEIGVGNPSNNVGGRGLRAYDNDGAQRPRPAMFYGCNRGWETPPTMWEAHHTRYLIYCHYRILPSLNLAMAPRSASSALA